MVPLSMHACVSFQISSGMHNTGGGKGFVVVSCPSDSEIVHRPFVHRGADENVKFLFNSLAVFFLSAVVFFGSFIKRKVISKSKKTQHSHQHHDERKACAQTQTCHSICSEMNCQTVLLEVILRPSKIWCTG